jgi:argininosuccinate lyase
MGGAQFSWGGRFREPMDALVARFNASVGFDQRLADHDIAGSKAHATMLGEVGLLGAADVKAIHAGLTQIGEEVAAGRFVWDDALEDVHMNIEARLVALIGEAGKRLHTARSRNDQVATDVRLYIRSAGAEVVAALTSLRRALIDQAAGTVDVLLPGYTHLQRAQPVRLAHHLLAHEAHVGRDCGRLRDALTRQDRSPLGSGALAGTPHPIDRERSAELLGFSGVTTNSLDAVGARDHLLEVMAGAVIAAIGMSRLAEELVLWASQEFAFVKLSDGYCTGSSMMPQKKNPDMPELVRGKSGRVLGDFVALATAVKALPLAYNKDLQEDKEALFDALDTVRDCAKVMAGTIATATWQPQAMSAALREGFVEATELADLLVEEGVPFREAHHRVGGLVGALASAEKTLGEASDALLEEHLKLDPAIVRPRLDHDAMVERRDQPGSPARRRVGEAIAAARAALEDSA